MVRERKPPALHFRQKLIRFYLNETPVPDFDMRAARRLGFLGGSFDPIHLGHLIIAQDAMEQMDLDRVYFVPARRNPHKSKDPLASDHDRLLMIEAAIAGKPHFSWLEWELETTEPSYTLHTALRIRQHFTEDQCFWIVGADQLPGLFQWHKIEQLVQTLEFIAVKRPQHELRRPEISGLHLHSVVGHPFEVSSTELRERISLGKPVDFFLPAAVNDYITINNPYQRVND